LKEGVSFQEYVFCDNHPVQHVTHTHTHLRAVNKIIKSNVSKDEEVEM